MNTMKAVRVHEHGNPGRVQLDRVPIPAPGPNEVLIKVGYAGINMVDTYWCRGLEGYRSSQLPYTLGMEGAGVIVAVGNAVTDFLVGDRVAGVMHLGAFAEYWSVPTSRIVRLPDQISVKTAGAITLQGLTAAFLTTHTYQVSTDDTVLVHAAAGGVGSMIVQFCVKSGARVIGTCSTGDKVQVARSRGCTDVIRYDQEDFAGEVKRLTNNHGVDVVFDAVGQATFERGLACLRPRGLMCLFGQSSGAVTPFDPQLLRTHGSLFFTRPSLTHYLDRRAVIASQLFDALIHNQIVPSRVAFAAPEETGAVLNRLADRQLSGKAAINFSNTN